MFAALAAFATFLSAQPVPGQAEAPAPSPGRSNEVGALTAAQQVEAQEAGWQSCVDASARDHAMRAGRAGVGVPPADVAFADCLGPEQSLREALIAAHPSGGIVAADSSIRDLQARLSGQLAVMMNDVYQRNNYE